LVVDIVKFNEVKDVSEEDSCIFSFAQNASQPRLEASELDQAIWSQGISREVVQNSLDAKCSSQPSETKRDKFVRLCEARVNKAVNKILNLQHLSNQNNYQYDTNYVATMVEMLNHEIATLKTQFSKFKSMGKK
jgi:capsule polysaccharide export protein KpsE/RkpR